MLGAERFVVETKTTAALQHPHILPLFDSGTADGFLYYVMPYIQGETLRTKLDRETQLGVDEAVKITVAVADALDHAHRQGVIHRDIEPENILLHEGRPMVADFGIALAVSAAAGGRMTETGLSLGTPESLPRLFARPAIEPASTSAPWLIGPGRLSRSWRGSSWGRPGQPGRPSSWPQGREPFRLIRLRAAELMRRGDVDV